MAQQLVQSSIADQAVTGYRFETHYLLSEDKQRRYRVYLAIPTQTAPAQGFPVLYLLDGNAVMDTLRTSDLETVAQTATPPVLVAVGYDIATRNDVVARSYDYTPPVYEKERMVTPTVRGHQGGGAAQFFSFLQQKIRPLIATRVPTDPSWQGLWGHSYGGLFVLYAANQTNSPFTHYVAADPSVWWYEQAVVAHWQQQDVNQLVPKSLMVLVGTQRQRHAARFTQQSQALFEQLQRLQATGWHLLYETYPDAGHGDMIAVALKKTLTYYFR